MARLTLKCLLFALYVQPIACKEPPRTTPTSVATAPSKERSLKPAESQAVPTLPKTSTTQWHTAPAKLTDMAALIRKESEVATAQKKRLIVYVGATWCEPCNRFHEAVDAGELAAEFPDLRFLAFDADQHESAIIAAGYASKYIPLFSLPGPDGQDQGRRIMGAIKGPGAVPYIVPRLKRLLQDAPTSATTH